ncbi:MAG: M48 family metalloprotease [Acidobacteria bacterium]|nr:M48 family metalloprotease [Acidobacteriota bacterium]
MNEDKATRFHRLRRRSAIIAAAWAVSLLALLLVTGGSLRLRGWAAGLLGPGGPHHLADWATTPLNASALPDFVFVPTVAFLCALAVALAHEIVAFPLALFTGFVLERRYGLSRQTVGEWGRDHLKALAIGLLFWGLSAGFVYLTLTLWRDGWWLVATAGAVVVSVILTWLAPVVLIPLFFKLNPLQDDSLRKRLTALCQRVGTGATDIYEWRLSDRTSRANAALTGFGRTRRILLSDTLVKDYSEDEIEVILAHELSHHVSRDLWWALGLEAVFVGLGFWAGNIVLGRLVPWLGLLGEADPAGLPLLLLTAMCVSALSLPLLNAISRWRERRADQFALDTTRSPAAFITAMKRLGASNLAEEAPSTFARLFFYTHPPLSDRLAFARAWAARQSTES